MPVSVRIHLLTPAPFPIAAIEAAIDRVQAIAFGAAPEVANACLACRSTEIVFDRIDYRTGVENETTNEDGWVCRKCGAVEQHCEEIVTMPAATFIAISRAIGMGRDEHQR